MRKADLNEEKISEQEMKNMIKETTSNSTGWMNLKGMTILFRGFLNIIAMGIVAILLAQKANETREVKNSFLNGAYSSCIVLLVVDLFYLYISRKQEIPKIVEKHLKSQSGAADNGGKCTGFWNWLKKLPGKVTKAIEKRMMMLYSFALMIVFYISYNYSSSRQNGAEKLIDEYHGIWVLLSPLFGFIFFAAVEYIQ